MPTAKMYAVWAAALFANDGALWKNAETMAIYDQPPDPFTAEKVRGVGSRSLQGLRLFVAHAIGLSGETERVAFLDGTPDPETKPKKKAKKAKAKIDTVPTADVSADAKGREAFVTWFGHSKIIDKINELFDSTLRANKMHPQQTIRKQAEILRLAKPGANVSLAFAIGALPPKDGAISDNIPALCTALYGDASHSQVLETVEPHCRTAVNSMAHHVWERYRKAKTAAGKRWVAAQATYEEKVDEFNSSGTTTVRKMHALIKAVQRFIEIATWNEDAAGESGILDEARSFLATMMSHVTREESEEVEGKPAAVAKGRARAKKIVAAHPLLATESEVKTIRAIYIDVFQKLQNREEDEEDPIDLDDLDVNAALDADGDLGVARWAGMTHDHIAGLLHWTDKRPPTFASNRSTNHTAWDDVWLNPEYAKENPDTVRPLTMMWHQTAGVAAMMDTFFTAEKVTTPADPDIPGAPTVPGMMLADSVGLGKTAQILGLIATLLQVREAQLMSPKGPLPPIIDILALRGTAVAARARAHFLLAWSSAVDQVASGAALALRAPAAHLLTGALPPVLPVYCALALGARSRTHTQGACKRCPRSPVERSASLRERHRAPSGVLPVRSGMASRRALALAPGARGVARITWLRTWVERLLSLSERHSAYLDTRYLRAGIIPGLRLPPCARDWLSKKPFFGGVHEVVPDYPHLVIAPTSLADQWISEVQTFNLKGSVEVYKFPTKATEWAGFWDDAKGAWKTSIMPKSKRIVIMQHSTIASMAGKVYRFAKAEHKGFATTKERNRSGSYNSWKRHLPWELDWNCVIVDEAHVARTVGRLFHGLNKVLGQAAVKLLATATPLQHTPKDISNLGRLLRIEGLCGEAGDAMDKEHENNVKRKRKELREVAKQESESVSHMVAHMSGASKVGSPIYNDLKQVTMDWLSQLSALYGGGNNGRIIRRSNDSLANDGKPIMSDLPPLIVTSVNVTLSQREYDNLADVTRDSGEEKKVMASWDQNSESFYLNLRLAIAVPASWNRADGEPRPPNYTSLEDLNTRGGNKLLTGLKLTKHLLIADDIGIPTFSGEHIYPDPPVRAPGQTVPRQRKLLFYHEFTMMADIIQSVIASLIFNRVIHLITFSFDSLFQAFEVSGINCIVYNGSMKLSERTKALNEFRSSSTHRVLLMSKVGTVGLNLTCADIAIALVGPVQPLSLATSNRYQDVPWSQIDLEQFWGRVHRFGQKRPVYGFLLVAENTFDQVMFTGGRGKVALLDVFLDREENRALVKKNFDSDNVVEPKSPSSDDDPAPPEPPTKPTEPSTTTTPKHDPKGKGRAIENTSEPEASPGDDQDPAPAPPLPNIGKMQIDGEPLHVHKSSHVMPFVDKKVEMNSNSDRGSPSPSPSADPPRTLKFRPIRPTRPTVASSSATNEFDFLSHTNSSISALDADGSSAISMDTASAASGASSALQVLDMLKDTSPLHEQNPQKPPAQPLPTQPLSSSEKQLIDHFNPKVSDAPDVTPSADQSAETPLVDHDEELGHREENDPRKTDSERESESSESSESGGEHTDPQTKRPASHSPDASNRRHKKQRPNDEFALPEKAPPIAGAAKGPKGGKRGGDSSGNKRGGGGGGRGSRKPQPRGA
ncbi:hypothetical protein HWV62_44115 [Athelia sp. TMB]|nr:hypothetical protein HWV62_44115 [Athelia sp. TMB]